MLLELCLGRCPGRTTLKGLLVRSEDRQSRDTVTSRLLWLGISPQPTQHHFPEI